ncbi:MAG: YdeI/OmpD-associated family protein [Bacteroidota bacterium]
MVEFKATIGDFNNELWRHHIPVPADIAEQFIEGDNRRVICTIMGEHKMNSALMAGKGYWFILLNKPTRTKYNISTGDSITVQLEKDRSEYGMEIPEEFLVVMDQDPTGTAFFKALTMGKQRSLIYLVNKVKNPDSRINKALAIMDHLNEAQGSLDFKALNVKIKEYNQRGKLR